jgi:hypothetical protein
MFIYATPQLVALFSDHGAVVGHPTTVDTQMVLGRHSVLTNISALRARVLASAKTIRCIGPTQR